MITVIALERRSDSGESSTVVKILKRRTLGARVGNAYLEGEPNAAVFGIDSFKPAGCREVPRGVASVDAIGGGLKLIIQR